MLSLVRGATACARSLEAVARPLAVRAYAKPARGGDDSSGDARSQYFLKLLEPQQTEKIERTPEELEDAMQRCARTQGTRGERGAAGEGRGGRRRWGAAVARETEMPGGG